MNNVTVNESDVLVSVVPDEITVTISDAVGIPPGGTANQVLKKNSATDYDVAWASDVAGVPYTGATQDVNLGEFGLLTGNIEFDTTPTNAPTGAGSMVWNDTEGTLDLMLKGASVNLPIGQKQVLRAVNGTGGNLTRAAYRAVKIIGAQGQRLQVSLARADNDANSKDTIGLVAEDIGNNQEGFIVTSGTIANINTTGSLQGETWADGDTLYLSGTTSGVITNVKPSAPIHTVILGFVIYAHQNNGKIYVKVDNGYELDELHNVSAPTPVSGEYLRYNGTVWVDSTIQAADLPTGIDAAKIGTGVVSNTEFGYLDGVTSAIQTQLNGKQATLTNPVTGTGTSGQVTYFSGTSTVTGSNNLFWDATNNRLGINTASPAYGLDVSGTLRNTTSAYFATSSGGVSIGTTVINNAYLRVYGGTNVPTLALQNDTSGVLTNDGFQLQISNNIAYVWNYENQAMLFGTNGTERIRINAGGNVSIGNTNNTYNLDISGTLRNTTSAYFATSSGGVGIGKTSVTTNYLLDVAGSVLFDTNGTGGQLAINAYGVLAGRIRTPFDGTGYTWLAIDVASGGSLLFTGNTTEWARFDSSGSLGIGTTSPQKKLSVVGGFSFGDQAASPQSEFSIYHNAAAATFALRNATASQNAGFNIRSNSGSLALTMFGTTDNSQGYQGLGTLNIGANDFTIFSTTTGSTPITRFFTGGAVSIGTNNNSYKLDISGTLRNTTDAYFATSSGNVGVGTTTFGTSAARVIGIVNGTAPTTSPTDVVQIYANDITAGNAALHVRTEGGAVIKLYQQTTGVAAATFAANTGTAVNDASTFDGYTLNQIVKALRNNGLLA
jgi:hypothetical protein